MRLLKIGRDASCDIVLHSDLVSALHAEIVLMDSGDIMLEDKGSRNGTYIMNQRIQPGKSVNVRRGDAIRFADVELQWSQVPMPEDNSAYKGIYGIGSNFNNYIQISGSTVSRYHATVKHGRDGKMYIVDHSKNGTTVDGMKISPNTPYRIKKKSAVVCGGVPADLSRLPWPSTAWKTILGIAAAILLLCGIGFGLYKLIDGRKGIYTDSELYARYNKSVVMMMGIYHYEVTIGDYDMNEINNIIATTLGKSAVIPQKMLWDSQYKRPVDITNFSQKDLIELTEKKGVYGGTGFFISEDGQLITNLHVVKPWLYEDAGKLLYNYYSQQLASVVELLNAINKVTSLSVLISQLKVDGVLDYIALLPQGESYDSDNIIKCRVISAGDEKEKDVALVQTISKRLPTSDCTYVNVIDSMDISEEALTVGEHVYTIGFPTVMNYQQVVQKSENEKGIQVVAQGGDIIQQDSEYDFGYNAVTTGGASGSPVFNKYGKLIGVHHQGLSRVETQGYNYGIKAKYVKELLDSPHKQ
jgi:pSer/pThr/pTyr-binding forkhead associated (FHA) protein/S1-C subfamily serine protease